MIKKIFLLTIFIALFINYSLAAEEDSTQLAQAVMGDAAISETTITPIPGGMQGKISLDLRSIDIVDALKFLAMKAGLNIVTTKKVTGRVELMVKDVAVKDIFDVMLRSNDLAYMKRGDIYNVMTEDEYKALHGEKFADIREVKSFRLKYAIPEQAFTLLDTLKSDVGRVYCEPDSGTLLIMDTPEKIKEIEKALAVLEQKNLVQTFKLKYANVKDVEEQLKAQLDAKKVGSIRADERSSQVIIQALPERMQDVEKLIEALDAKTRQVLIDTKIVKIKLSDELSAGVEWEGMFEVLKQYGMDFIGSHPLSSLDRTGEGFIDDYASRVAATTDLPSKSRIFTSTEKPPAGSKVTSGEKIYLGRTGEWETVVKYLQTLGNTQILSNPKLSVTDNQEARIHVGERQAYVTETTTTGSGGTKTVAEEVTFIDVGIQLSVTPRINDDGYISMKIKPEISSVTDTLETGTGNKIPIIDTSIAETTVLVKDGSTIVIGGLRKNEETEATEQVPFLGDIPLLGFLFKSTVKTTVRTELLILITPHIVSGDILTTGDERDFGYKPGKEYRDYRAFTEQTDFPPPEAPPEEMIKPYQKYTGLKKEQ